MPATMQPPADMLASLDAVLSRIRQEAESGPAFAPVSEREHNAAHRQQLLQVRDLADALLEVPGRCRRVWEDIRREPLLLDDDQLERFGAELFAPFDLALSLLERVTERIRGCEEQGWLIGRGLQLEEATAVVRCLRDQVRAWWPRRGRRRAHFDQGILAESRAAIARGEGLGLADLVRSFGDNGQAPSAPAQP